MLSDRSGIWHRALSTLLLVAVVLALLVLWARGAAASVTLGVYGSPAVGAGFLAAGLALMLAGLWQLRPPRPGLRSGGIFQLVPHPVYAGFTFACFGASMWAQSAPGLWLVTPCVALGCAALVLGYDRIHSVRRFGATLPFLPADDETKPTTYERIRFLTCTVLPWVAFYYFTIHLRLPGRAFAFEFEHTLPIWAWTTFAYQSTYVAVALAPWSARTRRDLRRLTISSWVATICVFTFYWIAPSTAPRRPLDKSSWIARMLSAERDIYPPTAAFPSFHVLWSIFIGRLYRPRIWGVLYVLLIAATCITTGMHYIPDILASLLIAPLFLWPGRVWHLLLRGAERLARSLGDRRVGRVGAVRATFGALAFLVQIAVAIYIAGRGNEWTVLVTGAAGIAGAALPFRFYSGVLALALACMFFDNSWLLLTAHCLAAPWMHATVRLGALLEEDGSARPHVAASVAANVVLGLILARLWMSSSSVALIVGAYAIGSGLVRFVEEAHRGEPHTREFFGVRLGQWIAIGLVVAGALVTTAVAPVAAALR